MRAGLPSAYTATHSLLHRRDSVAGACGPTTAPVTPSRGGKLRGLDDCEFRARFGLAVESEIGCLFTIAAAAASANSLTFGPHPGTGAQKQGGRLEAKKQPPWPTPPLLPCGLRCCIAALLVA